MGMGCSTTRAMHTTMKRARTPTTSSTGSCPPLLPPSVRPYATQLSSSAFVGFLDLEFFPLAFLLHVHTPLRHPAFSRDGWVQRRRSPSLLLSTHSHACVLHKARHPSFSCMCTIRLYFVGDLHMNCWVCRSSIGASYLFSSGSG